MPFIHITSLPFAGRFDAPAAISAISADFCAASGVAPRHVTVTWRYLEGGHHAVGGEPAFEQPRDSHPVLVDLLAPDFNTPEQVETMLCALAKSIASHCDIAPHNVFICYRAAASGCVFDAGDVVRWR